MLIRHSLVKKFQIQWSEVNILCNFSLFWQNLLLTCQRIIVCSKSLRQWEMEQYVCFQRRRIFKSYIMNERCFYLALLSSNAEILLNTVYSISDQQLTAEFFALENILKYSFKIFYIKSQGSVSSLLRIYTLGCKFTQTQKYRNYICSSWRHYYIIIARFK